MFGCLKVIEKVFKRCFKGASCLSQGCLRVFLLSQLSLGFPKTYRYCLQDIFGDSRVFQFRFKDDLGLLIGILRVFILIL